MKGRASETGVSVPGSRADPLPAEIEPPPFWRPPAFPAGAEREIPAQAAEAARRWPPAEARVKTGRLRPPDHRAIANARLRLRAVLQVLGSVGGSEIVACRAVGLTR